MVDVIEEQLAQPLRDKLSFARLVSLLVSLHWYRRHIFLIPISPLLSSHFHRSSSSDFLELYFFGYILLRKANNDILLHQPEISAINNNDGGRY
jgi:hypothetical protein